MLVSFISEDYQELIEDIVRDGRLYASENHQEILKVRMQGTGLRGSFLLSPMPLRLGVVAR